MDLLHLRATFHRALLLRASLVRYLWTTWPAPDVLLLPSSILLTLLYLHLWLLHVQAFLEEGAVDAEVGRRTQTIDACRRVHPNTSRLAWEHYVMHRRRVRLQ